MYNIGTIFPAQNLPDAIGALVKDPKALVLAGGTSLLVNIHGGRHGGRNLVSVAQVPELCGITMEPDGAIAIGACTTLQQVAGDALVLAHLPALAAAARLVAGPQTRNLATIGGNVCTGYMSADTSIALLALNAQAQIAGPEGTRYLPLEDFFTGPTRVALQTGEILAAVRVAAADYRGFGGSYVKRAARKALDFALLNCCAQIKLDADGNTVAALRLAYGVAAPKPLRCHGAEQLALGMAADGAMIEAVTAQALEEANPCKSCWRASREHRLYLVRELGAQALGQAIEHAKGALPC